MKAVLRILLVAVLAVAAWLPAHARIIPHEKAFGPKAGYISPNKGALAGLVFQYNVNSWLRVSPEVACAFRHHDKDALIIDLNFESPFSFSDNSKVALYPLVGLTFNSWSTHLDDLLDDVDVTTHTNRLGMNLGAGFDLRCSSSLRLNIEARYTLVRHYTGVAITAGISYLF